MIPVFISSEGRVVDFTKPNTPTPEVKQVEDSFDQMAARSADQQSTIKTKVK
ncbi:MAG: hypothetical protein WBQ68_11935 [Terriglobales bacterium]